MNTAKERLLKIIEEIPDNEVIKILDCVKNVKVKKEKTSSGDLTKAIEINLDYWDEVWNNV